MSVTPYMLQNKLTAQLEWYKKILSINWIVFMYGDRFLNKTEAAIPTAGIQEILSVFLLLDPAATKTE